jgi:hypothetical protein
MPWQEPKGLGIRGDKKGEAASEVIARYIVKGARRWKYDPKIPAVALLVRF